MALEADALEALAPPTATTAAAGRQGCPAPAQEPTPKSHVLKVSDLPQDTRMVLVVVCPPRVVTTNFLLSGCCCASAKVCEPAWVSLSLTVALAPRASE